MFTTYGMRMTHITLIFWLCAMMTLMVSGCTSRPAVTASATPFETRKVNEERAWTRIGGLSQSRCGVSGVPAREQAVGQSACITSLVYENVLPVAAFPDLVRETRGDAMKIAQDYAAGKMTPAEYTSRSQARLRAYKDRWNLLVVQEKVGFVQTVHAHQRKSAAPIVKTAQK